MLRSNEVEDPEHKKNNQSSNGNEERMYERQTLEKSTTEIENIKRSV